MQNMGEFREETVRTSVEPAGRVIEERTVHDDGRVTRVVHTAVPDVPRAPVRQTRTVSRFWRRSSGPPVGTEYVEGQIYSGEPTLAQVIRVSWFALGLLEAALVLRFALSLLGANERNDFAAAVYGLTWVFVAPFRTLFPTPASGGSSLELYTLVAMFFFLMAWWTIVKMIGVVLNRTIDV
jgi:hypothetical protein